MSHSSIPFWIPATVLLGGLLFCPLLPAAEVLIQTKFTEADEAGKPFAQPMAPPLSGPTRVVQGAAVSSITIGIEDSDGLQPPYALVSEKIKAGAESIERVLLYWDLKDMGCSEGVYELSYRFMVVSAGLESGARMIIELCGEGGRPLSLDPPIHVSALPAQIFVARGDFRPATNGLRVSSHPGEIREMKIVLDLDKLEWSSFVDGEELRESAPLPQAMRDGGYLQIQGLRFGSTSGSRTEAAYAIADVTLKRVEAGQ